MASATWQIMATVSPDTGTPPGARPEREEWTDRQREEWWERERQERERLDRERTEHAVAAIASGLQPELLRRLGGP